MSHVTISLREDIRRTLEQASRRLRWKKLSKAKRPTPGFVGIADQKLSYDASQIDAELDRTFGRNP